MKFKFYLVICFVLSLCCYAQDYDCGWYGTKTVAQRNKLFPFNKAGKILLISYPEPLLFNDVNTDTLSLKSAEVFLKGHIINKRIFKDKKSHNKNYFTLQEAELNEGWKNQLSHILVNYIPKKNPGGFYIASFASCYNPRNAILFLDEEDNIICCFEICFECERSVMIPDPDKLNEYADIEKCHLRLDELSFIFRKNAITYGIETK